MKWATVLVAASCLGVCASAAAQSLTPEEIDKAIRAGQEGTARQLIATCQAVGGFGELFKGEQAGLVFNGSYEVTVSQSAGQIALLSAAARRFYKPFLASQVPDVLKTVAVFMTAEPTGPYAETNGSISLAAPIELMVIKAWPNRNLFVRPSEFKTEPIEWPNVAGRTLRGTRARARFEIGQMGELTAGDLEATVVTQAGERSCILPARDRKRVFSR